MKRKITVCAVLVFVTVILSSCWNYREVNEMAIIVGAAIDKSTTEKYKLTVELLDVSGGQQTQISTSVLSVEGETVFDAARKLISVEGKRGYWGHIRILIVSEEIARDDIAEVVKFFRQDAEARGDLYVIISKGSAASEIFQADRALGDVISESLAQSLENSKYMSGIPEVRLYTLSQYLKSGRISPVLPALTIKTIENKKVPAFVGSAVFRKTKLVDYLTPDETEAMLFLKDEIGGGVLVTKTDSARISLEILGNKTKIRTRADNDTVSVYITVETRAAIDEVIGNIDFSNLAVLDEIKKSSEMQLKSRLEDVIKKAMEIKADIIGLGQKIYENSPDKWKEISNDYETELGNIHVNITVNVDIVNTSILYNQLNEGE